MSEHKDAVYTAPGHNAVERAQMIGILKRKLYPILGLLSFITVLTVIFYFFAVPGLNASGKHYFYQGIDEGPVGTYMGNMMLAIVPFMWMMVFCVVMIKWMDIPPKEDYATPLNGVGEVQRDEEWSQAEAKTEKMLCENFYTIIMRVPKGRFGFDPRPKKVGAYDLSINVGVHAYLLRRLRWDELTPEQQKQIEDAQAHDRRNQKIAFGAGFGAGVIIGSGGSVR